MEYDPFRESVTAPDPASAQAAWHPGTSISLGSTSSEMAQGGGTFPSPVPAVAGTAPWAMQQTFPQQPQAVNAEYAQYPSNQEGAHSFGADAHQAHLPHMAPPPDLLPPGPMTSAPYSLAAAASKSAPPWSSGTAVSYNGTQPPFDASQPSRDHEEAAAAPAYGSGKTAGEPPRPQHSVRGIVAAAKRRAMEMAANSAGGSLLHRSRGRSRSRSRSRERSRERRYRRRSRSDSRERSYSRRSSRDHSERSRRSRHHEGEDGRGAASDDCDERGPSYLRRRGRSDSREPQEPTPTVFIKGIPETSTEEDLQILLSPYPNVTSVRLVKNKETGMHRGFAFIDFTSAADASRFMEPGARQHHMLGGMRLYTEYAAPSQLLTAGAGSAESGPPLDWVCGMCQAVNFARRLECYQCSSPRPAIPKRVQMDTEGPSTILKVSGLSEDATEEGLRYIFSVLMPVLDVRLVRDKFSGAPRGFAFVELGSIADATRALNQLQNFLPEFQATPIRLCYARDRGGGQPAQSSAAVPLQAVQEMQELSGWAPKEFTEGEDAEGGVAQNDRQPQQEQQQQQAGAAAAPSDPAAAAASTPSQPSGTSGYIYDQASGYYYDPASGSHYDPKTGYFFIASTQQWCMYDQATGQYTPVSAAAGTTSGHSTAAHAALATTENALASQRVTALSGQGAPAAKSNRPKGAVIGAKPQYNSQGLLAAVQQLSEKEAQQKALAQQRSTVSGKPQVSKPPQTNPYSKANNPSPNPGLGMAPGAAASQAQPARQAQQQQQQQQQQPAQQPPSQEQQQQQQQQQAAESAVAGKIYRSKWSQRH